MGGAPSKQSQSECQGMSEANFQLPNASCLLAAGCGHVQRLWRHMFCQSKQEISNTGCKSKKPRFTPGEWPRPHCPPTPLTTFPPLPLLRAPPILFTKGRCQSPKHARQLYRRRPNNVPSARQFHIYYFGLFGLKTYEF